MIFQIHTFTCFDDQSHEELKKFNYYPYGLSISCIFLAITLAVYLIIPKVFFNFLDTSFILQIKMLKEPFFQLLNLHGKTVFCFVSSYLVAYITLAVLQLNQQNRSIFCYEAGQYCSYLFEDITEILYTFFIEKN